ncbi:MAG: MATE family efflux transporter [Parcubacteria group bacterium]|jgi:putative MATE family efflux protein
MQDQDLTSGDIGKQIRLIAIPASVGFFFNTMYNAVDTYFGGLVSTDALAALSLSFPVFFVIIALGVGISTGASALIANAIGAKDEEEARVYASQALSFSVIVSLFLTAIGFWVAPYLFMLLGAQGKYLQIATTYINIILLGSVFFSLTFVMSGILSARGDTATFRNFLIVGFFLNCFLDPVFMFGWLGLPAMGLAGVAWATIVIQIIGVVYMGWVLTQRGILCKECLPLLVPKLKYFKNLFAQGFPASLNMLTIAVGIFIITYFVAPFGKAAVAAYGIMTRMDQIAMLPSIGLTTAALTLIAQSNGAGNFERCRQIYRTVMRYGFFVVIVGMLVAYLFATPFIALFTHDAEVVKIGVHYLHISIWIYWAYMILYLVVSTLQGLKKPNFAIWIGIYRQAFAPIIFFYLFTRVLNWHLDGVWWGIFAINWTAVVISLLYAKKVMDKMLGVKK